MSEREPGDADPEAMHVISQKHSEAELKRLGINKPDFIHKKVDPFERSPGRTVPERIGKRRGGIGSLTLNQLRALQEAEKAEGVKQVQVQVARDQVGIEEMPETEGLFTIEDELEDMEEMGFERGGKVDGSSAPPSLSSTVTASAPGQEFTGQDVVRSNEEKTEREGGLRQKQGIPDGYVREDGKIWCPVIKKTSKTGKWFKAHGWVTREYFERKKHERKWYLR
jgi:hypothetical protein